MRNGLLIIFLIFLYNNVLFSQTLIERETINAGESLSQHFLYLYPSFANAIVKTKNADKVEFKMNINLFLSELEFIDTNGDTLSVAKPEEIDSVFLNGSVFFYSNKDLIEIKNNNDSIRLGILRKTNYEVVKIGAMGIPKHSGASMQSIKKLPGDFDNVGIRSLTPNENIDIEKETNFLLIDLRGGKYSASKSNFLICFPSLRNQINEQVKSSNIKFGNEKQVQQLLDFCLKHNF